MDTRALLALLFTVVVWGLGPVFIRSLSVDLGPADHLAIRYTLVSIVYLAALASIGGWRIEWRDWPRLLVISLIGMVGYNLGSAFGFERVSAGMGSLIIGTQPLLIAFLGTIIGREKLTAASIVGLSVAFSGTALLVWNDLNLASDSAGFLIGCAMLFLSGAAWAVYVVASKPLIQKYGAFSITAMSISIASAVMLILMARPSTIATVEAMSLRNWLDMAYIVVPSTLISAITWNYGASRLPAAASGAFIYLVPIIGVFSGAAMLNETITTGMLTGGGLILLGVAIAQFGPRMRSKRLQQVAD